MTSEMRWESSREREMSSFIAVWCQSAGEGAFALIGVPMDACGVDG
jgi:hypothetical protein